LEAREKDQTDVLEEYERVLVALGCSDGLIATLLIDSNKQAFRVLCEMTAEDVVAANPAPRPLRDERDTEAFAQKRAAWRDACVRDMAAQLAPCCFDDEHQTVLRAWLQA
jgi:hypothetical protein